jgi:capsid protein
LVYEEFVDEIVLKNLIELPGYLLNPLNKMAYLRCNWVGDSMGLIDPVKEITAAKMARQEQIKTSDDISREMTGRSYQENLDVLDDENQERKNKDMLFPDEYDRQTKRLAVEKQGEKIDG